MKKLITGVSVLGLTALTAAFAIHAVPNQVSRAATDAVVVNPANMHGWAFGVDSYPGGSGELVYGPETTPMGSGSARLTVNDTARHLLYKQTLQGTKLADLEVLEYSTFSDGASTVYAPSLQLNIDANTDDNVVSWQGRLVYEPYMNGTVTPGEWQTWNTLDENAVWWASGAPINSVCPQANPCTTAEVLAAFPNAGVHATLGAVNFKAGGPWMGGYTGYVDAFQVKVSENDAVTYDFEAMTQDKEECKKDGWKTFGNMFKNQGQCVSKVTASK